MKRILIAIKQTSEALPLAIAARALAGEGAAADVLHVAPGGDRGGSECVLATVDNLRARRLEATGHLHPDGDIPVSRAVAELAAEVDAEAVIMGARGLGGLRGLVEGSVSHGVLSATRVPVLVVPDGCRLPVSGFKRALAAVGGDADLERVLAAALAVAPEVEVAHAPRAVALHTGGRSYVEIPETSHDLFRTAQAQARAGHRKVAVESLGGSRPLAEEIGAAAARFNADLLVVGSRRPGGLEATFTGSTGYRLLAVGGLPVLFAAVD